VTGVLSLLVLVPAILGLYVFHLIGPWRWIYAAGAIAALYLNVVIGVAQAFAKVPALHTLAPTQSSLPFLLAQAVVLAAFVVLGAAAVRRFQPGMNPPSQRKRRPIGPPLTFNEDLRP
jgi:membrane protein implicated in regulation of membrane protease activity